MKKVLKKDERRRPGITRKISSSKLPTNQSNSGSQNIAPRRLKNKLYICGLLPTVLREELIREFAKFGKLHDVWVAKKPPGFAFIEYLNSRDAERVVHELDDTKVLGSKVRIEFAKANKGSEDSKKPKKQYPSVASSSGSKLLSNKPAIVPLMGQLIVPSLLNAGLGSSMSLLGSPPLPGLSLSTSGLIGTSYKRGRSPREGKRYRGDSGGRWEQGLNRKAISPLVRRFSRSPGGRGRMLSPPPKRSLAMPPSPFSRRDHRSIPSLLPPPPSRDMNASPPSKLMRMSGAALGRFSRSPLRMGNFRQLRRSLSRTHVRSPIKSWTRMSPQRVKRTSGGKLRRSISLVNKRSLSQQRRSASHGRERSASLRRNFVKSQVRTINRNLRSSRSHSVASQISQDKEQAKHESQLKGKDNFKRGSWNASPWRSKKHSDVRSNSSNSRSASGSPYARERKRTSNFRRSRNSSKSSINSEQNRIPRKHSSSRDDVSFDRHTSRSSNRRNSLSLRRNFCRSSERDYSIDQSPPLNFVRTRLLGRTPPSPPARSRTQEKEVNSNAELRPKSASQSPTRSNERVSKCKSYESRHSPNRSPTGRDRESESLASSGGVRLNPGVKDSRQRGSASSSPSSSRSSSSSRTSCQKVEKRCSSPLKSPQADQNSRELDKPRHSKQGIRMGSTTPESQNGANQRKRSHSVESSGVAKKRVCVRSKGGPRSPSKSPELRGNKFDHMQPTRDDLHQKRTSSSKSGNSNCRSDRSPEVSTGRKTPLAYQCPRESLSPPTRKKEFKYSKSPSTKSPRRVNLRRSSHAKTRSSHHNREAPKYARRASPLAERDYRHSPHHERQRIRYFKSPPPAVDHRHLRMLEDEISMRMERSHAPYYDDRHMDSRGSGYYRRSEYLGESDKGYYRRLSPLTHLPPPPQPSYPYRRMPEVQYPRGSRIRCEEVDQYYRTVDPYRGRVHNPPIIYRSGADPVYSRHRPFRR